MRVISGSARGKKLFSVEGLNTRPTTDRVKESIFNILQFSVYNATVLDLFAGTGQMGIEALSRGAKKCVFVDQSSNSINTVRKNIEGTCFFDDAKIFKTDFASYIKDNCKEKFDIIFLDPPYGGKVLNDALNYIETFDILNSDGIIICESGEKDLGTACG